MEGCDGSPPQSLCMIRAAELFPKPQMEKEDSELTVPFQELAGESVRYLGRTDDGVLALSNYRIFVLKNSTYSETSVPLGLIETAQARDLFHLIINCKDASTVKCSFETAEQCSEWQRRIQLSVGVPEALESLFAFPFCSWTCDGLTTNGIASVNGGGGVGGSRGGGDGDENAPSSACSMPDYSDRLQRATRCENDFMREVERLGFDDGSWRISDANKDFKLCPSYPKKILVPSCISDEMLHGVANFRGSRRLPAIVWRHRRSGAVLARCSQPEVGWLGWRNSKDEQLLKAIADACAFDRGEHKQQHRPEPQNNINNTTITTTATTNTNASGQKVTASDESTPSSPEDGSSHDGGEVVHVDLRKVLIVDARSYTSAVTNRARGGGCECIEYYPCAEIEFMNLGNIHVIRKSFHSLRQLCASPPDVPNWLGLLEKTMWLQHLSGLLAASMTVCHAMEKKGRPVLVHCSDGWDRTPQIVATAQLCLDPFYRTVEGFRILVEREWLSYGHKFADRCGHGPGSDELNERCPVFLQWLDLVHQIHKQFPCSFEFSMGYLIKLAQHSHSCLFGTFLCNTYRDRMENSVFERTFSVWPFLSGPMYRNPLYVPNREKVLWPAHNVRDLYLWTEVYLGSLGNQNCIDFPSNNVDGLHGSMSPMAKTRSYGDLISAGIIQSGISRRSSDPNMIVDPNLTIGSNSENNSIADTQSEREDSPDIETRQLENITIELNNHDHEENNYEQHYENQLNGDTATPTATKSYVDNMTTNNNKFVFSSPQNTNNNLKQNLGCELKATSIDSPNTFFNCSTTTAPLTSVACAVASTRNITKNGFNGFDGSNDIAATTTHHNGDNCVNNVDGDGCNRNVTIYRTGDLDLALMPNLEIDDLLPLYNPPATTSSTSADGDQENLWHGSITTSTDTLVPIDSNKQQQQLSYITTITNGDSINQRKTNDENGDLPCASTAPTYNNTVDSLFSAVKIEESLSRGDHKSTANNGNNTNSSSNFSILPEVHTSSKNSSCIDSRPNVLSNSSSNASVSSTSSSLNNLNKLSCNNLQQHQINNCNAANLKQSCDNNKINNDDSDDKPFSQTCLYSTLPSATASAAIATVSYSNAMEESILILPEHDKLDISPSGKCESVTNNVSNASASTTPLVAPYYFSNVIGAGNPAQRRRRTSSSNSRRDGLTLNKQQTNGSTISRFSLPGVRSLPMTPPGLPERLQIAISCPDGLAHALSEQNIRLQQIVHEHKIREDVLLREIHDMRIALLKKICPSCNNAPATNDEQCSVLDNIENASICSWEAVEERSGPSSCASMPPNSGATSVLWVPDHAVSRCTSCQTEFWLGRRKHHCRSCGQIFCADCSEFWAPLPDEKLFSPVRLCGPCYHSVTTRMQQQNRSFIVTNSNGNHINTLTTMTSTINTKASNNTSNNVLLTTSAPILQPQRQPNVVTTPNSITNSSSTTTTTTTHINDNNMPPHIPIGNNITASVAN